MGTVEGIRRPTLRAQRLRRDATPAERALWRIIGASRLGYKFSRQMPVGNYICDFLCRSHRLAIELDGETHTATVVGDHRRDAFIASHGIRMLRFTNRDVFENAEGVAADILAALGGLPHPQPLPQAGVEP